VQRIANYCRSAVFRGRRRGRRRVIGRLRGHRQPSLVSSRPDWRLRRAVAPTCSCVCHRTEAVHLSTKGRTRLRMSAHPTRTSASGVSSPRLRLIGADPRLSDLACTPAACLPHCLRFFVGDGPRTSYVPRPARLFAWLLRAKASPPKAKRLRPLDTATVGRPPSRKRARAPPARPAARGAESRPSAPAAGPNTWFEEAARCAGRARPP